MLIQVNLMKEYDVVQLFYDHMDQELILKMNQLLNYNRKFVKILFEDENVRLN